MQRFISIALIIVFSFLNISFASAQVIQIVTLEEAINQAVKNNPDLTSAMARLGVSEAQILTANALLNPALVSDNAFAERSFRVGILQVFELGGKRQKRTALAQAERDVVITEINTAILDLRQAVRNYYIQLFNAQEKVKAANDLLKTTEELLEVAKRKQLSGEIPAFDVIQIEIIKINAQNELQSAMLELAKARKGFNVSIGQLIKEEAELAPPGILSKFGDTKEEREKTLNNLIEQAYICRPELKTIIKNIEVANRQLDVALAKRIPDLILTVGPDISAGENVSFFVTASMELPVFNRQEGPIQEALARRNRAEKECEFRKRQIAMNVRSAYSRIISNSETIKIYETKLLPSAQDLVGKSRLCFANSKCKGDVLLPITAQQAYTNTRLGYVQALTEYQDAVSDLERAIGAPL